MKYIKQILKSFTSFFAVHDNELGLFLPRRHMSWVLALATLITLMSFMAGYFVGHQKALETFVKQLEEDSFADKVNYSLYALSDTQQDVEQEEAEQDVQNEVLEQDENDNEITSVSPQKILEKTTPHHDLDASLQTTIEESAETTMLALSKNKAAEDMIFVAPVAGFGTLQAAHTFVERARIYDAGMVVKKRTSINKNGKKIAWYQAVTSEFTSREALENVINILKKTEHIAHVNIIERKVTQA